MPFGFRAAAELDLEVTNLWSASIAPNTKSAYQTGMQCFTQFLTMSGCITRPGTLPILTEDVLIYFVTFCYKSLQLQLATIKLYLAGIRFHYLQAGMSNPMSSMDRLQCVLRGVKRSQGAKTRLRLPITFSILKQMCNFLHAGVFTPNLDLTLQCMCSLAYFGFLRCGEFTVKARNDDVYSYLKCQNVSFLTDHSMFCLTLPTSKTDPFSVGVDIPIYRNNSINCCPVYLMEQYLCLRREQLTSTASCYDISPLFIDVDGKPFTRTKFLYYVKQVLCRLGYDENKYSGHSFRIGAASSAAEANIEDHMIQTLGRWSSSCYTRYIRVARSAIQDAQARMCR